MQVILNHQQIHQKITRLGHELLENCFEEKELFIMAVWYMLTLIILFSAKSKGL